MTTESIMKERFDQLGLPPMELAEPSVNNRNNNGSMLRCLLPTLQKIIIILLLAIFGAGTYILLSKMLANYDCIGDTKIIVIKEANDNPSKVLHIISKYNKTQDSQMIRQKRDIHPASEDSVDNDDFNTLTFNDEQLQRARETIMEHDVRCNKENTEDICEDLVTKLKSIAMNNGSTNLEKPKISEDDSNNINMRTEATVESDKREITLTANSEKDKETKNLTQHGSPPDTSNNCIRNLLKNYVQTKDLLNPTFEYLTSPEIHNDHLSSLQKRFYQSAIPNSHVRDVEGPGRKMHPQDVDILVSFLTPKLDSPSKEQQAISTREVSCPEGTVPCFNGVACVEKKRWCDGYVDCVDVSDEARCNCKSRVDRSRLCDGYFDCPFGEDEMGCYGCNEDTFSCENFDTNSRTTCFTKEQRCNSIVECPNHKDEVECNMLAPTLLKKPIFAVSNTEGFLHRNFKGEWYAVCKNPYMWAHDVCRSESGLILRPPVIDPVTIDPMLKIKYINNDYGRLLETSDTCFNSTAVYVTCPDVLCGIRIKSTSQILRENIAIENHLFGRNKRFHQSNHPYPLMFYANRWKRNADNDIRTTNHEIKFDTPSTEESFGKTMNKRSEGRVVGGQPSQPAAWPWVVAIYRNGLFHCGGVVITHSWVISAAHCVNKFWDHYYEVQVGMLRRFSYSPQQQSYKVTHVIVNQHYSQSDMKNDLSLLKIEPTILFSRWVRPICLPTPNTAGEDWLRGPSPGTMCTAVGWGATKEHGPDPDHLREVELPIWDKCTHSEDLAGKEICAGLSKGGKDACQGDSGGPLLCRNPLNSEQWYLSGIVSHGDGCGREGEPGVYTRVSLFVHWIKHHTSSNSLPLIKPIQVCPGFTCESGFSKCLPNTRKCDKIVDCLDGEDEVNCEFTRTVSTLTENMFSPSNIIEDILVVKEAMIDSNKLPNVNKNNNNTTLADIETSTDGSELSFSTPYTVEENSIDDTMDFKHASTLELSITKSKEDISDVEEHVTADPYTTTNHENLPESRGDAETMTIEINGQPIESRSSVLAQGRAETTEKAISNNVDNTLTTIESFDQSIETSTHSFKQKDEIITTENTPLKINVNNLFSHEITHTSLETKQNNKGVNKSDDDLIIRLLPDSPLIIRDNIIGHTNTVKTTLNKTRGEGGVVKKVPNLHDKSILLNKIEDIVSSELQPATVRRKHRMPLEFQCRRIYQMISYHQRCDRKADCEDGTDELECSCTDYLLTFDEKLVCDGIFDCADGHDESNCFTCADNQFLCKQSQTCLSLKNVCDGKPQCPQGEDELDCFALTNGKEIYYDLDDRPTVNLEGYVTKKIFNDWHVVCDDKLTVEQQEQTATQICRYLGFGAANKYYVKHINSKAMEKEKPNTRNKRNAMEAVPIHFIYRRQNAVNESDKVVLKDAQVIKEECVPNITRTCKSLYVFCEHSLFTNFDESDNIFLRKTENMYSQMWPWAAKIFVEGEYRCIGVLVNLSWVLISESCLWDSTLGHNYISVVLGSHRTLDVINGMYEQAYRVDYKKDIYRSKVILLHLEEPAHYSNFVKPMIVSSSFTELDPNSTCVAIGQDNKNRTISIPIEETDNNCHPSQRCFNKKSKERICTSNTYSNQAWAGIISCHTERGWFPAASFVDSRGECGIEDRINATDIDNLKYEIKHLHGSKSISPAMDTHYDNCEGIRCGRGRCILLKEVCDGVRSCEDGKDESESSCIKKSSICSKDPYNKGCECSVGQLKCRNSKCIPKEFFRDGTDDCGDRTDEPGQSTCSHYLARVMPSRLCDGILHCHDRSDEDPMYCKCFSKKTYRCRTSSNEDHCVAPDTVCDGIRDCTNGEDEKICIALNWVPGTPRGTGQVIMRSHGVWHSKCYPTQNHTRSELEAICAELGFISGHAKQIQPTKNHVIHQHNSVIIDPFNDITLNNNTKIKMRNTHNPVAEPIFDENITDCYPVFIECL